MEEIREHPAISRITAVNGLKVRLMMEVLGVTTTELAQRTGLSRQTISHLVNSSPRSLAVTPDTRERIADALREYVTPERVL